MTRLLLILFKLECSGVKSVISALVGNKLFVIASFNDPSVIKHHYYVGVHDGRKTVSDNEYRSALHQLIHSSLYKSLGTGVD